MSVTFRREPSATQNAMEGKARILHRFAVTTFCQSYRRLNFSSGYIENHRRALASRNSLSFLHYWISLISGWLPLDIYWFDIMGIRFCHDTLLMFTSLPWQVDSRQLAMVVVKQCAPCHRILLLVCLSMLRARHAWSINCSSPVQEYCAHYTSATCARRPLCFVARRQKRKKKNILYQTKITILNFLISMIIILTLTFLPLYPLPLACDNKRHLFWTSLGSWSFILDPLFLPSYSLALFLPLVTQCCPAILADGSSFWPPRCFSSLELPVWWVLSPPSQSWSC